jgi:hypothetical protein
MIPANGQVEVRVRTGSAVLEIPALTVSEILERGRADVNAPSIRRRGDPSRLLTGPIENQSSSLP